LSGVKVFVDEHECGAFPSTTLPGQIYTVTCSEPIDGSTVKLETTTNEQLNFIGISVTGLVRDACVAFDFSDGFCYAYKKDPLADYIGSGDDDSFSCYTRDSLPDGCDTIYQETLDVTTSLVQIGIDYANL